MAHLLSRNCGKPRPNGKAGWIRISWTEWFRKIKGSMQHPKQSQILCSRMKSRIAGNRVSRPSEKFWMSPIQMVSGSTIITPLTGSLLSMKIPFTPTVRNYWKIGFMMKPMVLTPSIPNRRSSTSLSSTRNCRLPSTLHTTKVGISFWKTPDIFLRWEFWFWVFCWLASSLTNSNGKRMQCIFPPFVVGIKLPLPRSRPVFCW